jgi:broad specificity phosphatase PhoE
MTTTRLLLWRHGQTAWNADGRFQGQIDVPLDDTGRAQAVAVAARLAERRPDAIVASDLRRAADTASALAGLTGLAVALDPRLRERAYGQWQGLTMPEIEARWPQAVARWRAGEAVHEVGIEDLDDVAKRVAQALNDAAERSPGGTVVVATHGGAARRGIGAVLGWPDSVLRTLGTLANCCWSELRLDPVRGWRLWAHNVG